jgi:type II secretory pathway pseudopilin PulG
MIRRGTTLIELLIFLVIFSIVGAVVLPLLFRATEGRLLQQTVAIVEQNGTQLLQSVSARVRGSERVLDPPPGETGAVLALQTASGATSPTIIGISSGSLIVIRGTRSQTISSPQVAVEDFVVRNTSVSPSHPSVLVSFTVSRTIRLQAPHSYVQRYTAAFTLLPADRPVGDSCGCAVPTCGGAAYAWQVCQGIFCLSASAPLDCAP